MLHGSVPAGRGTARGALTGSRSNSNAARSRVRVRQPSCHRSSGCNETFPPDFTGPRIKPMPQRSIKQGGGGMHMPAIERRTISFTLVRPTMELNGPLRRAGE
jgi:hypothetical protein